MVRQVHRLRKRIDDAGIIRLIRAYLNSGFMTGGVAGRSQIDPYADCRVVLC